MIHLLAIALATLVASTSWAVTYEPCSPVFIAGPQGRPIPNNVVQITNLNGSVVVGGVWNDENGAVAFGNVLPANQVLQVFALGGVYRVNISGDGLTKQYQIVCGEFYGGDAKKISIDRTADVLNLQPNPSPTLVCPTSGKPCYLPFAFITQQSVSLDFMLPSFPLTLEEIRLSWKSTQPALAGDAIWRVSTCVYLQGMTPCIPVTNSSVTSTSPAGSVRIDAIVPITPALVAGWVANGHVVMHITRLAGTGIESTVDLENVRLEFVRF